MDSIVECRVYNGKTKLLHDKTGLGNVYADVKINASILNEEGSHLEMNTKEEELFSTFMTNYEIWNNETNFLSCDNYESANFKKITALGESIVPEIYKLIKERPNPIVYALDDIYPGLVEYEGYVSLKDACDTWISILPKIANV
ncbi:MAG: hypothetical protein Q4E52_07235 [Fibrobacter sp.]|nr:hypothetical protein [Fibrobacter sp.]